jgi:hypothetical protein
MCKCKACNYLNEKKETKCYYYCRFYTTLNDSPVILCDHHERELHLSGEKKFLQKYNILKVKPKANSKAKNNRSFCSQSILSTVG